jgi:hypothetical protein
MGQVIVLPDALTSVIGILALLAGRSYGWVLNIQM